MPRDDSRQPRLKLPLSPERNKHTFGSFPSLCPGQSRHFQQADKPIGCFSTRLVAAVARTVTRSPLGLGKFCRFVAVEILRDNVRSLRCQSSSTHQTQIDEMQDQRTRSIFVIQIDLASMMKQLRDNNDRPDCCRPHPLARREILFQIGTGTWRAQG